MHRALERDISELLLPFGATEDTVVALLSTLERKARDFGHEVDALAQGAPTTVSAAIDATLHAVEWMGEAIKKCTSRVATAGKA